MENMMNYAKKAKEEMDKHMHKVKEEMDKQSKNLEERTKELEEREKNFEETKKEVSSKYALQGEILELNISGKKFTTLQSTIKKYPESMLGAMFSGRFPILKDQKGRSFIDRPSKRFSVILTWLQTGGKLRIPKGIEIEEIEEELNYFGLFEEAFPSKRKQAAKEVKVAKEGNPVPLIDSKIVGENEKHQKKLQEWYLPEGKKMKLLYRGTRDGFKASDFHGHCDGKEGGTLTIIKTTKGNVFGGFTNVPWTSQNGVYREDGNASLFSLSGPCGTEKYPIKQEGKGKAVWREFYFFFSFISSSLIHFKKKTSLYL